MCAWVRSYGFIRTLPYQRSSQKPLPAPRVVYWGVVSARTFFCLQETGLVPSCPRVSPSSGCCAARASGLGLALAARIVVAVVASPAGTCRGSWWEKVFGAGRSCRMQCVSDTCVSRAWQGGGISLSLVLLAAAKHCLLLPRQGSGHAARWFLTKREVWQCQDMGSPTQRSAAARGASAQLCACACPCRYPALARGT